MLYLRKSQHLDPKASLDNYFKSAFTVDNVIFGFDEGELKILLIVRGEMPHKDSWALPGYFVQPNEDLPEAAARVLRETTGLERVYLEQLETFGTPDRHPFGRVITVAYYSLVKVADFTPRALGLATDVAWHPLSAMDVMVFDHADIVRAAIAHLQERIRTHPVGFELLPPEFTLTQLQHLYEAVWGTELEKRNFRKKILSMKLIIPLERFQQGVSHRPARLYRFDEDRYRELTRAGFNFEVKG